MQNDETQFVNPYLLGEREFIAKRVMQALDDYRNGGKSICIDCKKPVRECAWEWLESDECDLLCELMGIDHDAMLERLRREPNGSRRVSANRS